MGLFSRLFGRGKANTPIQKTSFETVECQQLWDLSRFMDGLTSSNHYVAKSEYRNRLLEDRKVVEYFGVLKKSQLLSEYCKNNGIPQPMVETTLEHYSDFENIVHRHNDEYVARALKEEEKYLDNILSQVDPAIKLDQDQRKVVLTDEDYSLVIAGAGAGKTTTVAAKVKYLVERKGVDPRQILVVSFTNKAVQELKDKLNRDLNIPCPIATFHSTGNAIIRKQVPEKLNIVDSYKLYYVIMDYFRDSVLKNESMVNNLILFFGSYFDTPYTGSDLNEFFNKIARTNLSTLRGELDDFKREIMDIRTKKQVTLQNEIMRSLQEVEIANFLYLNNIDYDYEPIYKYNIRNSGKPYTPDFIIRQGDNEAYLEHFGITEDGKNWLYTDSQLRVYKQAIKDKIQLHRQHGTKLIYTFSKYLDGKSLTDHLAMELNRHGFTMTPRSNREVMEKLITTEENRYIKKLVMLICRFISNFKTNGYDDSEFGRMRTKTGNERTRLFLDICQECYFEYQRFLRENNAVDFEDMINESARLLNEVKEMKQKLDFKYIIVDEYQDISKQRFDLVKALSEVTEAKIIAVGDDWQSIYAFSGSDITLFTKFAEKMGYAKLLKIESTYRNSQEVIDIAGSFIQKNETQITKSLISPKTIQDPVIIYTYDGRPKKWNADRRSGADYNLAVAVETALGQIMEYNKAEGKKNDSSILLLGRYGFDGDKLEKSGLFEVRNRTGSIKSIKYPKLNITFMTAHASKGLGYDNVIVINGRNETFGFPSKVEDDPVLSLVIKGDKSMEYAEERRLFYVAMTRTKNRVYFVAPENNPSEFLLEIKKDYKNVVLKGNWNENSVRENPFKKTCPICGYPLQFRYKPAYGLRLFICTNEPELCGFMTNDYRGGKLSILKCDECRDGYLVVKPPSQGAGYFLGCTNYRQDKHGCNRKMSLQYYMELMHLPPDIAEPVKMPKAMDIAPKIQEKPVTPKASEQRPGPVGKPAAGDTKAPVHRTVAEGKPAVSDAKAPVHRTVAEGEPAAGDAKAPVHRTVAEGKPAAGDTKAPGRRTVAEGKSAAGDVKAPVQRSGPEGKPAAGDINDGEKIEKAQMGAVSYDGQDLNEVVYTILNCLVHVSQIKYYGLTMLVDVLQGEGSDRIQKAKLYEVPEYGVLREMKRKDLFDICEWMIGKHYMLRTNHPQYPVLHPTEEGMHYCKYLTRQQLVALRQRLGK